MSQAKVVTLHPLNETEALAWISGQVDKRSETSVSELAQQFGWPVTKLRRKLADWIDTGTVTREPTARRGKFIIDVPATDLPPQHENGSPGVPALLDMQATREAAARLVERAFTDIAPSIRRHRPSLITTVTAGILLTTAICMTFVGLIMNARFAASFGQTMEAAALLATIGLAIDVLAVALPTVAAQLWHGGSRVTAPIAWAIWLVTLVMTLLAATGFASTNIGDAVAGRAKMAAESVALVETMDRLRAERAGIDETRPIAAIEAELQRAQPGAQRVWRITDGCRDVTRITSGRLCGPVLELREAIAKAERRDAIDADLKAAEARHKVLPPIHAADPQAKTAAEMITWVSGGLVRPGAQDIFWLRTIGLAMMPSLGGLIAMLALQLVRDRRID